jgi:hypothetical protein
MSLNTQHSGAEQQGELLKDIPETNGVYSASNLGRVRSNERKCKGRGSVMRVVKEKILDCGKWNGYPRVGINPRKKESSSIATHILIAWTWIPNPQNKPYVNHINGIRHDNRVSNLEWVTPRENAIHAYRTGLMKPVRFGVNHYLHKFSENDIVEIRKIIKMGWPCTFIADAYEVHSKSIYDIKYKVTWKHVR